MAVLEITDNQNRVVDPEMKTEDRACNNNTKIFNSEIQRFARILARF